MALNTEQKVSSGKISSYQSSEFGASLGELFKMGRPSTFVENIDPNHRIGNYLRNKMNIIDLIPCDFSISLDKVTNPAEGISGMVPKILYDEYIKEYQERCQKYGLEPFEGLRLYTTDDTTASDSLNNKYSQNIISEAVNKAGSFARQIAQGAQSFGANELREKGGEKIEGLIERLPAGLQAAAKSAFNVAGLGHRVGLPQVWDDSDYSPNFQTNIKLVSPYGHYNAVKEFIIKPLMYLLILSSARTSDMVSYYRPLTLTIDAYGHSHTPIGYISNITFRRGGNDSSFNIYKQPLTIDISLSFEFLVQGFATLSKQAKSGVDGTIDDAGMFVYSSNKSSGNTPSLPTLSHIITSLRPYKPDVELHGHTNMSAAHNWGDDSSVGQIESPVSSKAGEVDQLAELNKSTTTTEQANQDSANNSASKIAKNMNENTDNTSNNNSAFNSIVGVG